MNKLINDLQLLIMQNEDVIYNLGLDGCGVEKEHREHLKKENKYYERVITELQELEALKKELGIDLITLFKALKDGIIVVDDNYECHGLSKYRGQEIDLNIFLKRLEIKFVGCWNLSDYGKTWALSRSELEE